MTARPGAGPVKPDTGADRPGAGLRCSPSSRGWRNGLPPLPAWRFDSPVQFNADFAVAVGLALDAVPGIRPSPFGASATPLAGRRGGDAAPGRDPGDRLAGRKRCDRRRLAASTCRSGSPSPLILHRLLRAAQGERLGAARPGASASACRSPVIVAATSATGASSAAGSARRTPSPRSPSAPSCWRSRPTWSRCCCSRLAPGAAPLRRAAACGRCRGAAPVRAPAALFRKASYPRLRWPHYPGVRAGDRRRRQPRAGRRGRPAGAADFGPAPAQASSVDLLLLGLRDRLRSGQLLPAGAARSRRPRRGGAIPHALRDQERPAARAQRRSAAGPAPTGRGPRRRSALSRTLRRARGRERPGRPSAWSTSAISRAPALVGSVASSSVMPVFHAARHHRHARGPGGARPPAACAIRSSRMCSAGARWQSRNDGTSQCPPRAMRRAPRPRSVGSRPSRNRTRLHGGGTADRADTARPPPARISAIARRPARRRRRPAPHETM